MTSFSVNSKDLLDTNKNPTLSLSPREILNNERIPKPMVSAEKTRVSIRNYGDYSSSNYGAHTLQVTIGYLQLYFSYQTVIAFNFDSGLRVCENAWGTTTGKHLNCLDGGNKKGRIPHAQFQAELEQVLERCNLSC